MQFNESPVNRVAIDAMKCTANIKRIPRSDERYFFKNIYTIPQNISMGWKGLINSSSFKLYLISGKVEYWTLLREICRGFFCHNQESIWLQLFDITGGMSKMCRQIVVELKNFIWAKNWMKKLKKTLTSEAS